MTKKHSGLFFLGGDYLKILQYLGLDKFSIKLSRNRVEIIDNQKEIQKEIPTLKELRMFIFRINPYQI